MRTDQLAKLIGRPAAVAPLPVSGRYPSRVLRWEATKGGIGATVCVGIVLGMQPPTGFAVVLLGIAALFGAYSLQQLRRVPLQYTVDDAGVTQVHGAERKPVRWSELKELRVNYYPNGRKAGQGTLVMLLNGKELKIDSNLDCFPTLLHRAAQAARERGLTLHPTTEANLVKLEL